MFPGFTDFNDDMWTDFFRNNERGDLPAVNVSETDDKYTIEVAAPGLDKNDFKIDFDNGLLTISSEKEEKNDVKEKNYTRREFCYTSFRRSFTVPDSVDSEKIKAAHQNGVLSIELPKKEEAVKKAPKTIKIS